MKQVGLRLYRAQASFAVRILGLVILPIVASLAVVLRAQADLEAAQVRALESERAAALAVAAAVLALLLYVWRQFSRRLQALQRAATRWARGDWDYRASIRGPDELGALGLAFDQMAEQLQARASERRAVQRLKDEFVSTVSHELRTPLNGVIGMTELLSTTDLSPCQREYVGALRRSGEALLALVNDILDLSKLEAGRLDLEAVDLDVRAIVQGVVALLDDQVDRASLTIRAVVHDDVPDTLCGDPAHLRQVLMNLVGNAVKFTERGEVVIRVRAAQADGRLLRFDVADTGIGIAPDVRERLFQPFAPGDSSTTRRYGGSGLGLAICQRLVTQMGGEIGVESEPGRGSTFWFTVRFARPSADAPPPPEPAAGATGAGRAGPVAAGRILVVEDSAVNQHVVMGLLQRLGYSADVASNGREALAALKHGQYAAVLMDCQMPELDGFETTAVIRRREGDGPHVPVIAMTAGALPVDRERCAAAGMDDYVTKPFGMQALANVLGRWVSAGSPAAAAVRPPDRAAGSVAPAVQALETTALARLPAARRGAVLDAFERNAPRRLAELRAAVAAEDANSLTRAAHTLKGEASALGAAELRTACARLDRSELLTRSAETVVLVEAVGAALERTLRALERRRSTCEC